MVKECEVTMDRVILITGASRGLGQVMYEHLSRVDGFKVYGTSRRPRNSGLLSLDIRSDTSVKDCLATIITIEGHLDVLINNVGSNLIGSLEGTSMEAYENQMALNFYGTLRMMKAVMPYFRQRKQGRIINISSIGARIPLPFNSSYAASKAALEAMSISFSSEIDLGKVFVSLVEPIALSIEDEVPNLTYIDHEKAYHQASKKMFEKMRREVKPSVSKLEVALLVEKVIKSRQPRLTYRVGKEAGFLIVAKLVLPFRWFQYLMKKALL